MVCVVTSLNCYWGSCFGRDCEFTNTQVIVLNRLILEVERFGSLGLCTVGIDWSGLLTTKGMRSKLLSGSPGRYRPGLAKGDWCGATGRGVLLRLSGVRVVV